MADGILHPQRTEVVVRGDGNCFYRAIALWRDETSDRKHGEIRSLCNSLIEKYPQVFQPLLFASRSVEEHVKKSKLAGSWAETVDIFSCATLLKRTISTFSTKEKKWFTFNPLKITNFSSSMERKKGCECPITLKYYDDYAQANHFNLLLPQGNCCNAPPPENKPSSVVIDLDNVGQSYASAVKQSSKTCPPTKISSTTTNTTNQSPQTHPTKQRKGNLSSTDTAAKKSSSACSSIDSAKQPSQATYFKQRSPTSTKANHKQPTPANVTTAKQTSANFEATQPSQPLKNFVKQSFPAPTNGTTPKTNSAMESSQDPAPKAKNPSPATKTTTTQPSSTSTSSKQPYATPNFDNMDIKAIKEFISARGVQVSNYRKPQLIELAKAIASMDLPIDPDFENCSIDECLIRRLTLPAGLKIPDPFQMSSLSHDFSQLPPFGLMDIFNHLIMSKTDYDKAMLSSWRSFEEYNLCLNGHVQSLGVKTVQDLDGSTYFVFVAGVIPTQKEKTQEGEKYYRLWFVLDSNGSVYSAFCRCKGGADQGCRHLGATLFELDDFLSNQRKSVTSVSAYWNPKPTPKNKPVPLLEMKVSHGHGKRNKRKVTAQDDSWIDSFDPRPMKHRNEITLNEKLEFAQKLRKIDPFSGILDFLPAPKTSDDNDDSQQSEYNISHLPIMSQAKKYIEANVDNTSESNLSDVAEEFLTVLTFSNSDRENINKATQGQHQSKTWHEMRHLLVTGKTIKALYTRQNTIEKNPLTDVSLTVKNFITQKEYKENQRYPDAIEYGIKEESNAKFYYSKVCEKQHSAFKLEEPGLLLSTEYSWLGASLDGIRKCSCCNPAVVEFKCPFNGKDLDPKNAFLLPSVGGVKDKDGNFSLDNNHLHYFQVQTYMAVSGYNTCEFVTYTSKGIHVVKVNFNADFWKTVVTKVNKFYCKQIVPSILLEAFKSLKQ